MVKEAFGNISRKIDQVWFGKKSFESPSSYKNIGINYFRKYSIPTGEFWGNSLLFPIRWVRFGSEESLKNMRTTTKLVEGLHVGLGVGLAAFALDLYQKGQTELASAVSVLNLAGNGSGILLSRYNRLRIEVALEHMHALNQPKPVSLRDYYPSLESDDWICERTIKETLHALEDDGFFPRVA